jgi:uncharacterized protein
MRMQGQFLRIYVHENDRHDGRPTWEWLLEEASRLGVRGGSVFKAMAGFGRHHVLHESRFFELAGSLAVEVEFIATDDEARLLLELMRAAKVEAFYSLVAAQFGSVRDS